MPPTWCVLALALALGAAGRAAAQASAFPSFASSGGPPFLDGPIFQMDPADPETSVLATGFVGNGTYTLATTGPDGVVTLIGRYSAWECGPQPGSYLAAVEVSVVQPDGTSSDQLMCEYGLLDSSLGTNTMITAADRCPTSLDGAITLSYFPNYPQAPNTCVADAPAPAPYEPAQASAPSPSDALVAGAPAPTPEEAVSPAPTPEEAVSPAPTPEEAPAPSPADEGSLEVQGDGGGGDSSGGDAEQLVQCVQGCLDDDSFKPLCAFSKSDPGLPTFVVPNKCALKCYEKHGPPEYSDLDSNKADKLPDKKRCKENAQVLYVDKSMDDTECTLC